MDKELRKKAKKKVEAKIGFYICAIVFTFVTVILLMLGYYMPDVSFFLMLPVPVFIMVLVILYLFAFGLPTTGALSKDWQEEEIEKEMIRLYRQQNDPPAPLEDLSESEKLELKELERLKRKWEGDEDFV